MLQIVLLRSQMIVNFHVHVQWCRRVVVAWCRWPVKLSSCRVLLHLALAASQSAAVPSHILGVLKLPPDNASTSVYSTLLPPRTHHVTKSRVLDNMATCWRSGTRGTCLCVLDVNVKLTYLFHTQTTFRSFRCRHLQLTISWFTIFWELKVDNNNCFVPDKLCNYIITEYFCYLP